MHAVTGNLVYNHFSHPCTYRVHLDLAGDRSLKSPPSPAGRYLMQRGLRHEADVFRDFQERYPGEVILITKDPNLSPEADLERRAQATIEAMRAGAAVILHGVLIARPKSAKTPAIADEADRTALVFRGEPDILFRVDRPSEAFGKHTYIVGDVKSSHHAQMAQKMQVVFYSWILADLFGFVPGEGFVVNGRGVREDFAIDDLLWTLLLFVEEEVYECIHEKKTFYHVDARCSGCHWRDHCRERAAKEDDVSLIPGSTRSLKRGLDLAGVTSRAALKAKGDEELRRLARLFGHRLDGFRDLQKAASAQEFKRAIIKQHPKTATAQLTTSENHAPDLFRHRGPLFLVAGLFDGTAGSEAVLAAVTRRKDDLLRATDAREGLRWFELEHGRAGTALFRLLEEKKELERLLPREQILVVLTDAALEYRLRHVAERLEPERRGTIDRLERFLNDAVTLTEIVERTYFLPEEARRVQDLARLMPAAGPDDVFRKRSPFQADIAAGGPYPFKEGAYAEAERRLREVVADYELDPAVIDDPDHDRRPIVVREWVTGGAEEFRALARFEVVEDLRAAERVTAHLLRLGGGGR